METEILKEILLKEEELNLYDEKVFGIPYWRLIRFKTRTHLLKIITNFEYKTKPNKFSKKQFIINFFSSLFKYAKIFLKRKRIINNVVFAFPRLSKFENNYFDKFTDPVIAYSDINESNIIFQRPLAGTQTKNRLHRENVVYTDMIESFAKLFGYLFIPIVFILYFKTIYKTFSKAKIFFKLGYKNLILFTYKLSYFLISFRFHKALLRKLKAKRVFLVDREVFFPIIHACKSLNISVYEMQHGVTHGETILYSGLYDSKIDPDFFLVFGEAWIGPQFGMPLKKIINIGWAYKEMTKKVEAVKNYPSNCFLVISEPHITDKIIEVCIELSMSKQNHEFHIRLHPQEHLNPSQIQLINGYKNIIIQDNVIESNIVIKSYKYIIGENSSVMYEALSIGKTVGRINFGGLSPDKLDYENIDGFVYLNDKSDIEKLIEHSAIESKDNKIYGDFQKSIIKTLK